MSRAMNVNLPEAEVVALCEKFAVSISAIEPLPSGGTHLVCTRSEGAEEMRVKMKAHIVEGVVRRFPFYRARGAW
ncbi:hypothetical protein [Novosphingobium sp. AP12]|jgi:hypothetical protein|uniref:hypothetical protein n=1 Tax=Novosphingobium sp. AP12 TaxID=1144305 RepID=UPI000271E6D8|nr:hypothetical protein [Novosphingobium sp. AP12]EJL35269.1 hypothetical protein PMI02_00100 [Novosphingobium sp. AP12]